MSTFTLEKVICQLWSAFVVKEEFLGTSLAKTSFQQNCVRCKVFYFLASDFWLWVAQVHL